jgi:hypothetical protein
MMMKMRAIIKAVIVCIERSVNMKFVQVKMESCKKYTKTFRLILIYFSSIKKLVSIVLKMVKITEKTVESMLRPWKLV